jgi:hypothetical protein
LALSTRLTSGLIHSTANFSIWGFACLIRILME